MSAISVRVASSLLASVFVVAAFLHVPRAHAGDETSPAPTRADSVFWIHLRSGDSLEARGVAKGWDDYLRYRRPDGTMAHVLAVRVTRILDASGVDLRELVVRKRRPVGILEGRPKAKYRSFAFQGGDRTVCASFLLTEVGVLYRLGGGGDATALGDIGWMKNVGEKSAWGASVFGESESDRGRAGLRARYRRWLGPRTSVELSPGVVLLGNDEFVGPGLIGLAALNLGDVISVVGEGEIDRVRVADSGALAGERTRYGTDHSFRVGVRGGSFVSVGVTMGLAVIVLVFLASIHSNY